MLAAEKQASLVARLQPVEDAQERLALLVGLGRKLTTLPEALRVEEHRVRGCTSRVWLVPELREGRCHFRLEADSSVVKGLAACVCELYQGATPAEAVAWEPTLLEELRLSAHVSPTRAHGLQAVRAAIRQFAEANLP